MCCSQAFAYSQEIAELVGNYQAQNCRWQGKNYTGAWFSVSVGSDYYSHFQNLSLTIRMTADAQGKMPTAFVGTEIRSLDAINLPASFDIFNARTNHTVSVQHHIENDQQMLSIDSVTRSKNYVGSKVNVETVRISAGIKNVDHIQVSKRDYQYGVAIPTIRFSHCHLQRIRD